jgi:hypothetical protein
MHTNLGSGGKLVLSEIINPETFRTGFSFGLLEGWWLSEYSNAPWKQPVS